MRRNRLFYRLASGMIVIVALFNIPPAFALKSATFSVNDGDDGTSTMPSNIVEVTQYLGSATTSIPIDVPPGRVGLQPNLSLDYSSNGSNGWIGMGWDIPIKAIQRSTKNGVDYTSDAYVAMQGSASELVPRPGWGQNVYGAKIEAEFTKYYDNGDDGWLAISKGGTRFFYGQGAHSRQDDPEDSSRIFKWCLDKVVDTNGNYMTLTYEKDQRVGMDTPKFRATSLGGMPGTKSFFAASTFPGAMLRFRPPMRPHFLAASKPALVCSTQNLCAIRKSGP